MTGSKRRAEELLDRWADATARPVPAFQPRTTRRHGPLRGIAVIVLAGLVVIAALGAVAIGGNVRTTPKAQESPKLASPAGLVASPTESAEPVASVAASVPPAASPAGSLVPAPPGKLAISAASALASAPGIRYALKVHIEYANHTQHLDSSGEIDFERHRFSGIADGEGGSMPLFGGPSSGAVTVAEGLYVRSDIGDWEQIADPKSPLDRLTDPSTLSDAIAKWVAASKVDPATRIAPCGNQPCQVVRLDVPKTALADLLDYVAGQNATSLPDDLAPISVDLEFDASGFPVGMITEVTAGTTTTTVSLDLSRVDPAPTISPPIP